MKSLHTRIITAAVLASSLLLGACSSGEGEEADFTTETSSSTVTSAEESSSEETTTEETSEEEESESDAQATEDDAAEPDAEGDQAEDPAQAPAPAARANENGAPAPQQGQEQDAAAQQQAQGQQEAPQNQGPADRQSVINGMNGVAAASGEDLSAFPQEALDMVYGCMADSLIGQGANDLTHSIANQQDRALTAEESGMLQTATQTCYSQLVG